jgi:hypothetical protein
MAKIGPNSTIADVVDTLIDRENYLRGVVGNLSPRHRQHQQHGDAVVRIGITGEGKAPHCRVETPPDAPGNQPGRTAFNGRNHEILVDDDLLMEPNWSERSMTLAEVRMLLGQVMSIRRPASS